MRLFDKYLLACTNQRIPMPKVWQESLGLDLSKNVQTKIIDEKASVSGGTAELTGYRFQQDDVLQRGYVHRQVNSLDFDEQARYLLSLYLIAFQEHKDLDFVHYFNVGVSTKAGTYYITRAPIIRDRTYSIFGSTTLPLDVTLYSEASGAVYYKSTINSISLFKSYTLKTADLLDKFYNDHSHAGDPLRQYKWEDEDEYLMLEIQGNVKVSILPGEYKPLGFYHKDGVFMPQGVNFPSAGCVPGLLYSDKLIPALLDMQITDDSPLELISQIRGMKAGDSVKDKIKEYTTSLYDVDGYIGNKTNFKELLW